MDAGAGLGHHFWHDHRHFCRAGRLLGRRPRHQPSPPAPPGFLSVGRHAIQGSSIPILDAESPRKLWPTVDVYLSSDPLRPVARVEIATEKRGRFFSAAFTAAQPFDSILLQTTIKGADNGRLPVWMSDFKPASFGKEGQQYVRLRSLKLERWATRDHAAK